MQCCAACHRQSPVRGTWLSAELTWPGLADSGPAAVGWTPCRGGGECWRAWLSLPPATPEGLRKATAQSCFVPQSTHRVTLFPRHGVFSQTWFGFSLNPSHRTLLHGSFCKVFLHHHTGVTSSPARSSCSNHSSDLSSLASYSKGLEVTLKNYSFSLARAAYTRELVAYRAEF